MGSGYIRIQHFSQKQVKVLTYIDGTRYSDVVHSFGVL